MRRLIGLGLPAASQITLEVGVFAAATALAGRLPPAALAAHQIAINIAAFTFMVPLGVASAGAVRVGQAIGRRDPAGAARAGWTALLFGAGFMSCCGRRVPAAARGADRRVHRRRSVCSDVGVSLLMVAAVFQLFDGVQASRPACCAGSATRAPPCRGIWRATGSSACRSATCSASSWASAWSGCGGGCRSA